MKSKKATKDVNREWAASNFAARVVTKDKHGGRVEEGKKNVVGNLLWRVALKLELTAPPALL